MFPYLPLFRLPETNASLSDVFFFNFLAVFESFLFFFKPETKMFFFLSNYVCYETMEITLAQK